MYLVSLFTLLALVSLSCRDLRLLRRDLDRDRDWELAELATAIIIDQYELRVCGTFFGLWLPRPDLLGLLGGDPLNLLRTPTVLPIATPISREILTSPFYRHLETRSRSSCCCRQILWTRMG